MGFRKPYLFLIKSNSHNMQVYYDRMQNNTDLICRISIVW